VGEIAAKKIRKRLDSHFPHPTATVDLYRRFRRLMKSADFLCSWCETSASPTQEHPKNFSQPIPQQLLCERQLPAPIR
jgi:hypothetical protein